jgi:hypothetical protein
VRAAFGAEQASATAAPGADEPGPAPSRGDLLAAHFSDSLQQLERKQRRTAALAAVACSVVVLGLLAAVFVLPVLPIESRAFGELSARTIRADRVALTGDLRLVDALGNELAVFGRDHAGAEAAGSDAPVVLALNAAGDPERQLLRLAASRTGAALTLQAPQGSASMTLLSVESGPTLELRSGEHTQRLSSGAPEELPAVASGPLTAPQAVLAASPQRRAVPRGQLPEVRDIGHGFLVAGLTAAATPAGLVLRGRVVNATSIAHDNLVLRATLGDASETFGISKISAGNSTGFAVSLAGASAESLSSARIDYLGSTVSYQASSVEPLYGRLAEQN